MDQEQRTMDGTKDQERRTKDAPPSVLPCCRCARRAIGFVLSIEREPISNFGVKRCQHGICGQSSQRAFGICDGEIELTTGSVGRCESVQDDRLAFARFCESALR